MQNAGYTTTNEKFRLAPLLNILSPYWFSEDKWAARGLLAIIILLNIGLVYLTVLLNKWNLFFYDALQNLDYEAFKIQLLRFTCIAFAYIFIRVYRLYLTQMLEIKWRRWLTQRYISGWMKNEAYYRMSLGTYRADNPDQRIAEDVRLFTSGFLSLSLGILSALVSICWFAGILWSLSGPLVVSAFSREISVPGYLVWVALLYAGVGSICAHKIGRPLIPLTFLQQRYEADFRFGLVRVRENAEAIALYEGEEPEQRRLSSSFSKIFANWWSLMRCQKRLTWFTGSYTQVAIVFPFVVSAPRYFSGAIQLGGLMQIASAFANVESNLSWFVDNYRQFAEWRASANRLSGFDAALAEANAAVPAVQYEESSPNELAVQQLALFLPDGRQLGNILSCSLEAGSRLLVRGRSGAGKSTFFRTLAGIWPFASGRVRIPPSSVRMFLPQKPYIPIGSLREAILYPGGAEVPSDEDVRAALRLCGLGDFSTRLDEENHWEQVLSSGEQQRLAFARVLLRRPSWIFLDEATAAVDDAAQEELYRVVLSNLPQSGIVSIGHRPGIEPFHDKQILIGF